MFKKYVVLPIIAIFYLLFSITLFADNDGGLLIAIQQNNLTKIATLLSEESVDINKLDHLSTLPSPELSEQLLTRGLEQQRFIGLVMSIDNFAPTQENDRKQLIEELLAKKLVDPNILLEVVFNKHWQEIDNSYREFPLADSVQKSYIELALMKEASFVNIKTDGKIIAILLKEACCNGRATAFPWWPIVAGAAGGVGGLSVGALATYAYLNHRNHLKTAKESAAPPEEAVAAIAPFEEIHPFREDQQPRSRVDIFVAGPGLSALDTIVALPVREKIQTMLGRTIMPIPPEVVVQTVQQNRSSDSISQLFNGLYEWFILEDQTLVNEELDLIPLDDNYRIGSYSLTPLEQTLLVMEYQIEQGEVNPYLIDPKKHREILEKLAATSPEKIRTLLMKACRNKSLFKKAYNYVVGEKTALEEEAAPQKPNNH